MRQCQMLSFGSVCCACVCFIFTNTKRESKEAEVCWFKKHWCYALFTPYTCFPSFFSPSLHRKIISTMNIDVALCRLVSYWRSWTHRPLTTMPMRWLLDRTWSSPTTWASKFSSNICRDWLFNPESRRGEQRTLYKTATDFVWEIPFVQSFYVFRPFLSFVFKDERSDPTFV